MPWNPFKFKYNAAYLKEEGSHAILELRRGTQTELIYFPKSLLPLEATVGSSFTLKIEDSETAQSSEAKTMQRLLEQLIQ
ncbi:hypothetical protein IPG41_01705 [Candidatus Peregrinibacteria bacterium]|nr:MAG: hypothetical protein IPG41_01705 [Candidatus Peregrinibacteria bacterium]